MEAVSNTTALANAAKNKAKTPEMRRILRARVDKYLHAGWTTAQQHIVFKGNDLADAPSRDRHDFFITKANERGIATHRLQHFELDERVHADLETLLDDAKADD